jgi:hypothetical protein
MLDEATLWPALLRGCTSWRHEKAATFRSLDSPQDTAKSPLTNLLPAGQRLYQLVATASDVILQDAPCCHAITLA